MLLLLLLASAAQGLVVDESLTNQDVMNMLIHQQVELNTLKEKVAQLEEQECALTCSATQSPSFMASLTQTLDQCGADQSVIFENVRLNIGSGYDNRHGVFRAPKNGTYFFSTTLSASPNKTFHVAFVKNNNNVPMGYLYADASSIWHERSTSIITRLNVGDDVWIKCLSASYINGGSGYIEGSYHSHVSGFMISK